MALNLRRRLSRASVFAFASGVAVCGLGFFALKAGMDRTSTDEYCASCHVHPQATDSWKQGPHSKTDSGLVAHCVDCHLPPSGVSHYQEKVRAGLRDLYGYYFTDVAQIDWEALSSYEHALNYTFDSSCLSCHVELFPPALSNKGVDAHLHFRKNREELRCINCHLQVGHYHEGAPAEIVDLSSETEVEAVADRAPSIDEIPSDAFVDYTERIPGTDVRFEMVAIQGGAYRLGSPPSENGREDDEGPQREVELSSFWMGRVEVTWQEWEAFYAETATRGKNESGEQTDAITGPTPPYGSPDQGWGRGSRPAITMTHYAARKYCEWLSARTGRSYRLPTEAEWEYASRAGSQGPHFFAPEEERSFWAELFGGGDDFAEQLQQYAWFELNSRLRTHPAYSREPNPWGLINMAGNVREFCLDFYDPQAYASYPEVGVKNPTGPATGTEHVVRGGSFRSPALELRSAARDRTRHDAWLKTDPQNPKSVWWYSDVKDVGFRVVRPREPKAARQ